MRNFFRQILGIQTVKICLINPDLFGGNESDIEYFMSGFANVPVKFVFTSLVSEIKFVDTGIPVPEFRFKKRKDEL